MREEDEKEEGQKVELDTERMMFAANPEWWHHLYGQQDGQAPDGMQVRYPTTDEEFQEVLAEWEAAGA